MICNQYCIFSYSLFIYYLKITWKTHKPYTFAMVCLLSSRFISKNVSFLLFIQLSFPARQKFLRESSLWLRVWMKHALQESLQLSWYSYLLILDTNKRSGHVRDGNSSQRLGLESHLSRINKDSGLDLDSWTADSRLDLDSWTADSRLDLDSWRADSRLDLDSWTADSRLDLDSWTADSRLDLDSWLVRLVKNASHLV